MNTVSPRMFRTKCQGAADRTGAPKRVSMTSTMLAIFGAKRHQHA